MNPNFRPAIASLLIAACALLTSVSSQSATAKNAIFGDSFDPATGFITIGAIVAGDTEYQDVVVEIGRLISYRTTPATSRQDVFDPATGQVTIRSLLVAGVQYTDVVITVKSVRSVGAAKSVPSDTPLTPNDPLFADQWHLQNTGQTGRNGHPGVSGEDLNVARAWQVATGQGVQIAIVDDGLDIYHEDLSVVPGKSWDYRVNAYGDPSSGTAHHGTACAGLAAAVGNNGVGLTGVAFNARLVGYNLLEATSSAFDADAMTKDLADNHIYSNSYGATDGLGTLQQADAAWLAAIETGLAQGRNGMGAIYVWAAGNGAPADRSDFDGQANFHGVLSVASLTDQGTASSYSEPGANLLVSGYGGEYCDTHTLSTTDLSGQNGSNSGRSANDYAALPNYTRCMNGSSGAAPEIAGLVALMLEVNPDLTWRDVRLILAHTARKNDPTQAGWTQNGAGWHINHLYGYGAADALAAVTKAKSWVNVPPQKSATAYLAADLAVPDAGAPVNSTISLTQSGITSIEFVELTITSDHSNIGDLAITLTSPTGTTSTVALSHTCKSDWGNTVSCGAGLATGFRFGIARLIGEVADGRWTLTVQDAKSGNTGTLQSWQIRVMGH